MPVAAVDRLRKDTQKSKELEDVKKKADEAFKEIEKLKSELAAVKADKNKQKEYAKTADILSAADWLEKGYQHNLKNEHDSAIEAYTKAIALDPNLVLAYNNRGNDYNNKGQHDRAIEDLNKAIAFVNRGLAYSYKRQHDRAIEDYNKAIALNPNNALPYYNFACMYSLKGDKLKACDHFSKTVEKGFKNWEYFKKDSDLDNIRNDDCYKRIMEGR
ncbi:MAG: tetratricopeptide repeat protein [Deltaproteobacteria bacterium]|nr:tetratricopeptide repeat protein [Deltaproteobacteria bacterium]